MSIKSLLQNYDRCKSLEDFESLMEELFLEYSNTSEKFNHLIMFALCVCRIHVFFFQHELSYDEINEYNGWERSIQYTSLESLDSLLEELLFEYFCSKDPKVKKILLLKLLSAAQNILSLLQQ